MNVNNIVKIIEEDNISEYKKINLHWTTVIAEIENYSSKDELDRDYFIPGFIQEIKKDQCDVLKYAVHNNAINIVNFLLEDWKVNVNSYGENYGFPILLMSIYNKNYMIAEKIMNHSSFNPIQRNNLTALIRIQENNNNDLICLYVKKLDLNDFKFCNYHLMQFCKNEKQYKLIEEIYKSKGGRKLIDIFDPSSLLNFIAENNSVFMFKKISKNITTKILLNHIEKIKNYNKNDVFFNIELENPVINDIKINILSKNMVLLKKCFELDPIMFIYFDISNIDNLEKKGISVFDIRNEKEKAFDIVFFENPALSNLSEDLNNERKIIDYYLINHYDRVIDYINEENINIEKYKYLNGFILKNKLSKNLNEYNCDGNIKKNKI